MDEPVTVLLVVQVDVIVFLDVVMLVKVCIVVVVEDHVAAVPVELIVVVDGIVNVVERVVVGRVSVTG